jgi:uncharacterized membrane protein
MRRTTTFLLGLCLCLAAADIAAAERAFFSGLGRLEAGMPPVMACGISADGSVPLGLAADPEGWWLLRITPENGKERLLGVNPPRHPYPTCPDADISASGDVVRLWRSVWREGSGVEELDLSRAGFEYGAANAMSSDGRVIVGLSGNGHPRLDDLASLEALIWTEADGARGLGPLPDGYSDSEAWGVNHDGTVVIGSLYDDTQPPRTWIYPWAHRSFRWTEGGGYEVLENPGDSCEITKAHLISRGGSVVVGRCSPQAGSVPVYPTIVAVRWTEEGGEHLGWLPGRPAWSVPSAMSARGSVIVGSGLRRFRPINRTRDVAIVWTEATGWRKIEGLLRAELPRRERERFEGWKLTFAVGVSADGATIVGKGINPWGRLAGWIAHIPSLALDAGLGLPAAD